MNNKTCHLIHIVGVVVWIVWRIYDSLVPSDTNCCHFTSSDDGHCMSFSWGMKFPNFYPFSFFFKKKNI